MFGISELPRVDGIVTGDFKAKHESDSFSCEGYGFRFVDGVTVEPVRGIIPGRLHAAHGGAVQFIPCSRDDGMLAVAWMAERGAPPARIDEALAQLDAAFPVALPEPVAEPVAEPEPEQLFATDDVDTAKSKKGKR